MPPCDHKHLWNRGMLLMRWWMNGVLMDLLPVCGTTRVTCIDSHITAGYHSNLLSPMKMTVDLLVLVFSGEYHSTCERWAQHSWSLAMMVWSLTCALVSYFCEVLLLLVCIGWRFLHTLKIVDCKTQQTYDRLVLPAVMRTLTKSKGRIT